MTDKIHDPTLRRVPNVSRKLKTHETDSLLPQAACEWFQEWRVPPRAGAIRQNKRIIDGG